MGGQVTRYTVLENLIRRHGWKRGAELGVAQGQTFFHLLDSIPDLSMVGVDRWERTPGPKQDRELGLTSYANKPMEEYAAKVIARSQNYGARARIIHLDTVLAATFVPDDHFDFVFIDASHDTKSVSADICAWEPKVKVHGWMLGHDINWPSVRRAVDAEFGQAWAVLDANIWATRKRS